MKTRSTTDKAENAVINLVGHRPAVIATLVACAMTLVAASCGQSDGNVVDSPDGDTATATDSVSDGTTDPGSSHTGSADEPSVAGIGGGEGGDGRRARATVVIGETSYEFSLDADITAQCVVFSGSAIIGNGFTLDESGNILRIEDSGAEKNAQIVDFEITPTDYESLGGEPPWITVEDEIEGQTWIADPRSQYQFAPGTSQVDTWTVEGRMASGTATFADPTGERPPTSGTFELSCE